MKTPWSRQSRFNSETLTWPALVPHDEVFAGSRAWISAEQPAIDEKLAAPPVLALVQHLLQPGMHTRNRETKALQYLHQKGSSNGEQHGHPSLLSQPWHKVGTGAQCSWYRRSHGLGED